MPAFHKNRVHTCRSTNIYQRCQQERTRDWQMQSNHESNFTADAWRVCRHIMWHVCEHAETYSVLYVARICLFNVRPWMNYTRVSTKCTRSILFNPPAQYSFLSPFSIFTRALWKFLHNKLLSELSLTYCQVVVEIKLSICVAEVLWIEYGLGYGKILKFEMYSYNKTNKMH